MLEEAEKYAHARAGLAPPGTGVFPPMPVAVAARPTRPAGSALPGRHPFSSVPLLD